MPSYYHNWDALKTDVTRVGQPGITPFTLYETLVDRLKGTVAGMNDIDMHGHAKSLLEREYHGEFRPNYRSGQYAQSVIDGLPSAGAYILAQFLGDVLLRRSAITQMAHHSPVDAFDLAKTMRDPDSLLIATEQLVERRNYLQRAWFASVRDLRSPELVRKIVGPNPELDKSSWWWVALTPQEQQWVERAVVHRQLSASLSAIKR